MLDKATVLSALFTIIDDAMKRSAMTQQALKRPGLAPHLSDSEVITLTLYQELIGEPREDHFFRLHQNSLRSFFPGLNERSRYNRHKRDLWAVILAVRTSLQLMLHALEREENAAKPGVELLDSFSHHLQRLRLRLICETVNAQEQLHLSKHYARSTWGLMTRIAAKITAHSGGMVLNSFLGRPVLQ